MLPIISIVGRPNVGKSTLFNRLTKSRNAIVADEPGLTRDRQYGYGHCHEKSFIVIDTGGIGDETKNLDNLVTDQVNQAVQDSDIILFVVDAQTGLTPTDKIIAQKLRSQNKPLFIVLNKIDGKNPSVASAEFHEFGLGKPISISASHNRGINKLLEKVTDKLPKKTEEQEEKIEGIKLALIGRPNVGKSTLVNQLLDEERVVVSAIPGTTRDSIYVPFRRGKKQYTLIDTAGVRRKGKVFATIEKFSVVKTLNAIEDCHVALLIIDGTEGITDQDLKLLGLIIDKGRALVIAINKWDALTLDDKKSVKNELDRRVNFLDYVKIHFFSALEGTGIGGLFRSVDNAYYSSTKELPTSALTRALEKAVEAHEPPLARGRRIKLRFAHPGGINPQTIVIHGGQAQALPKSYIKYLENTFRKAFKITGAPIQIELKTTENPYKNLKHHTETVSDKKRARKLDKKTKTSSRSRKPLSDKNKTKKVSSKPKPTSRNKKSPLDKNKTTKLSSKSKPTSRNKTSSPRKSTSGPKKPATRTQSRRTTIKPSRTGIKSRRPTTKRPHH